jgi:hypothetical protein
MVLNDESRKPKIQEPKIMASPVMTPPEFRKPMFNPKPAPPIEIFNPQSSPMESNEDELDIPAFIRKKMK